MIGTIYEELPQQWHTKCPVQWTFRIPRWFGWFGKLYYRVWGLWNSKVVVSNICYFHPYWGKIPLLTHIFQRGWDHQLENNGIGYRFFFAQFTFLHMHTERTLRRNLAINILRLHFDQFVSLQREVCFLSSLISYHTILYIMNQKYVIYILSIYIYISFQLTHGLSSCITLTNPWR